MTLAQDLARQGRLAGLLYLVIIVTGLGADAFSYSSTSGFDARMKPPRLQGTSA